MQITEHIHALKIDFTLPMAPGVTLNRFAYVYVIFGKRIYLVDTGVKTGVPAIFDYIEQAGRRPEEIAAVILTHCHPDHIGGARIIRDACGCEICIHESDASWTEDTGKQFESRPVPGFDQLVAGDVPVDRVLRDGDRLVFEDAVDLNVLHTPGHSAGSVALRYPGDTALFTGDTLLVPGEMPIYEDILELAESVRRLSRLKGVGTLFSSWESPVSGKESIKDRIGRSLEHLRRIHETVCRIADGRSLDPMDLCRQYIAESGLPPFAANPLVAKGLASSRDRCHIDLLVE